MSGVWVDGEGEGNALYNPTAGEMIASCSTRSLDLKAALAFARTRGGVSLSKMTFMERGELLAQMSQTIQGNGPKLARLIKT